MSMKESDYDFLCTNDTRQIKLAIQGDAFFAAAVQSETAKKIDLSGGTKNIENITLAHCLKLTRIIWPSDTGAIKRVAIHSADSLASLDLSSLTNLEELSIFNCAELETITGLGKTLRIVNLHGVNLKNLDLSHAKNLEELNVLTLHSDFNLSVKNLTALQFLAIQGNKITANIQQCTSLVSLLINSSHHNEVNLINCPNLVDISLPNEHSTINGLEDCKKAIRHATTSQKTLELKKLAEAFIAPILQHKPGPEDMETVIQKYGTIRERNHACIIMISLLSTMEKTLTLELEKPTAQTAAVSTQTSVYDDYPLMIFLPEKRNIKVPPNALQQAKRFPSKEDEIIYLLQNPDENNASSILVQQKDLSNPAIFNLLKKIDQQRRPLMFKQIPYPQFFIRRIYADFPRHLLRRTSPFLFRELEAPAVATLPPAVALPAVGVSPLLDLDVDKRFFNAQRMLTDIRHALQFRYANNAIRRLMASLRHAQAMARAHATAQAEEQAKMRGQLDQRLQGKLGAAGKTVEPKKHFQLGEPSYPPPQSLNPEGALVPYKELFKTQTPQSGIPIDVPPSILGNPESIDLKSIRIQKILNQPISEPPHLIEEPITGPALNNIIENKKIHLDRSRGLPVEGQPQSQPPELIAAADRVLLALELLNHTAATKVKTHGKQIEAPPALSAAERTAAEFVLIDFIRQYEDTEFNLPPPILEQPAKLQRELKQGTAESHIGAEPSLNTESEELAALVNLSHDIEYFSTTLTLMTQEAKKHAKPDDQTIHSATLIIEKSISTTLENLKFAKSISAPSIKADHLLKAAEELYSALKKLNEACKIAPKPIPDKQQKEQTERGHLIDLLKNISQSYLATKDQPRSVFATGVYSIRLRMLNNWLDALQKHQTIPIDSFNLTLDELQKDNLLKPALQPAVESLKKYLTSSPELTKRK